MTAPTRPTLPQLRDRIQADIEYHLPGANARAEESLLNTLSEANAGAFHGLYGYVEYLANQLLPDTADLEWLARWAIMLEVPRQAATKARGGAHAIGTGAIEAGTQLVDPKTHRLYQVSSTVTGSNPLIVVEALQAGVVGNAPIHTVLQFQTPVQGFRAEVTSLPLEGGADQESIDNWRNRVARKLAERSKIGDRDDYAQWARDAHPGIKDAWVYPHEMGIGTVVIRAIGVSPNIIPDNATLAAAQVELDKRRNAGATVFLIAATPYTVPIEISGITDPQMQAGITRELELLFRVKQQQSATLRESEIDAAIQRYTLNYTLIQPRQDLQCAPHEVFMLGVIRWHV